MRGGGETDQNDLEVQGVFSEAGKFLYKKSIWNGYEIFFAGYSGQNPDNSDGEGSSVTSQGSNISGLCLADVLAQSVKGGGDSDSDTEVVRAKKMPPKTTSDSTQTPNIGFQPIPGET